MEPALEIDRVEWHSASPRAVSVRVIGRWPGRVSEGSPVLLVDDGGRRHAFPAMAEEPGDLAQEREAGAWRASFSVPIELRPRLESGLALEMGGREMPIPGAVAGAAPDAGRPDAAGEVIDRGVLAERRARRVELNEQALMRRLAEADARVTTLESQLANLEQRLEQTAHEREQTSRDISEREQEVQRVKQREYAEQQLRVEAEARLAGAERRARIELDELHRRLADVESEAVVLAEATEAARRELAQAQHAAAAERAGVHRGRQQIAEREVEVSRRELALIEAEQKVTEGLAAANFAQEDLATLRRELEAQREGLDQRLAALESRAIELQGELEREQAARQRAEQQLAVERQRVAARGAGVPGPAGSGAVSDGEAGPEDGGAHTIAALQAELERRTRIQDQVQAEIATLHEELQRMRASAREQADRDSSAERMLGELQRTIGSLRDELQMLEQRQREIEGEAERTRGELADRDEALRRAGEHAGQEAGELERLREAAQERGRALEEAERTIVAVRESAAELQELLDRERGEHARTAASLGEQARTAASLGERDAVGHEVEALRVQLGTLRTEAEQRADREAELERMVRELMGTASQLRGGFERELGALQAEAQAQVLADQEGYLHELAVMEQRVDGLRRDLIGTAVGMRAELESERASRGRAENALADEHERLAAELAARRELEAELESLRRELNDLRDRAQHAGGESAPEAVSTPKPAAEAEADTGASGAAPVPTAAPATPHAAPPAQREGPHGEMAEALSEAAQRLRARTEPVGDGDVEQSGGAGAPALPGSPSGEPGAVLSAGAHAGEGPLAPHSPRRPSTETSEQPEEGASPSDPALTIPPDARPLASAAFSAAPPGRTPPWLASAIRGVASHRNAGLAGELVVELLPVQGLVIDRPVTYDLKLAGVGDFRVSIPGDGPARVSPLREPDVDTKATRQAPAAAKPEFSLEGPTEAFSELVAGGTGRRLQGVRVRGRKRRARRLIRARRQAVALGDLARAEIRVWPGLLLLAVAEAIDPQWTSGHRFVIAYAIQASPGALLYIEVRDGQPVLISHEPPDAPPAATVYVSELSLLCLLAGVAAPADEPAMMIGDVSAVEQFTRWSDRVQGLGIQG